MDSNHWTGDDTREFGIDPDDEQCPECGVGPLEDCTRECGCRSCRQAEWDRQDQDKGAA